MEQLPSLTALAVCALFGVGVALLAAVWRGREVRPFPEEDEHDG